MSFIIKDILNRDSGLINKEEKLKEALQNILDLQEIGGLLSSMIQKKEFLNMIIELFCEQVTEKTNLEEGEKMISQLIFVKLWHILRNNPILETKLIFLKKQVLIKLLKKLERLTLEISRVYDESVPVKTDEQNQPQNEKEEDLLKKIEKRKGVGYVPEGSGKKWMVNEYLNQKEARNQFILFLLQLLNDLIDIDFTAEEAKVHWQVRDSFYNTICESCLLPLLESSFKSSSLHEMAKENDLYTEYCKMIQIMSKHEHLRSLLERIPSTYKPVQTESILQILVSQEENTKLFRSFQHDESQDQEDLKSIQLAENIMISINNIKQYYPNFFKIKSENEEFLSQQEIESLLKLPLNEQYKKSLSDFRFGLCKMTISKHHYFSFHRNESKTSQTGRMVRLAQEMTALSSSLPNDSYNAIFVRAD